MKSITLRIACFLTVFIMTDLFWLKSDSYSQTDYLQVYGRVSGASNIAIFDTENYQNPTLIKSSLLFSISANSQKIAYFKSQWELYVSNLDGSEEVFVTSIPLENPPSTISISPTGSKVAFHTFFSGLHVIDLSTGVTRIVNQNANNSWIGTYADIISKGMESSLWPKWSMDESKLLYRVLDAPYAKIFMVNLNDEDPVSPIQVTFPENEELIGSSAYSYDVDVDITEDGSKLIVQRETFFYDNANDIFLHRHRLFVKDTESTVEGQVIFDETYYATINDPYQLPISPRWNQDGSQIAYITQEPVILASPVAIYTMNADGNNKTRVYISDDGILVPERLGKWASGTDSDEIVIQSPKDNEIVRPGEPYTIRFNTTSDIESVNLYLVRTFTPSGPRTLLAENVPAASGSYEWEVPEDFLSPSTYIIAVDADDPDIEASSDRFRVRDPWRLYRQTGTPSEPEYEQFRLAEHSFSFSQDDENVWPQPYWDRPYHYYNNMTVGYDPFVGTDVRYDMEWFDLSSAATHPSWPAMVRAFDTYGTYASLEPWAVGDQLLHQPNPEAAGWWKFHIDRINGKYEGICYGISMAVLAAFQDPERFDSVWLPGGGSRNLSQLQPTDEVLDAVHALFTYQFGRLQQRENLINRMNITPRQTLARLKGMFESDVRDLDRLLMFESYLDEYDEEGNQKYGGHVVVPLGMDDLGDGLYEIGVFDPNYNPPGSGGNENPGFVYIDSTANSWWVDDETWAGDTDRGLHLSIEAIYAFDPASSRWPHVFVQEQTEKLAANSDDPQEMYHIGILGGGGAVTLGTNELRYENSVRTETIPSGYISFPATGRASEPYAYVVPAGSFYQTETIPRDDGTAGIRIEAGTVTSEFRQSASTSQARAVVDMLEDGYTVAAGGDGEFDLSLLVRAEGGEIRSIRASHIAQSDPSGLHIAVDSERFILGGGAESGTYRLLLGRTVTGERRSFYHSDVPLAAGSIHIINPDWNTLGESSVTIEVDLNGGGEIDEILVLENQGLPTTVESLENEVPLEFSLSQNYPNPFNPTTTIRYSLNKLADVELKVFDLLGREVAVMVDSRQSTGVYEVRFDASSLPSGIYIYHLSAGSEVRTGKMTLIK